MHDLHSFLGLNIPTVNGVGREEVSKYAHFCRQIQKYGPSGGVLH